MVGIIIEPIRVILEKSSGIKSLIDVLIAATPTVIGVIIGALLTSFYEWIKWKRERKQRKLESNKSNIEKTTLLIYKLRKEVKYIQMRLLIYISGNGLKLDSATEKINTIDELGIMIDYFFPEYKSTYDDLENKINDFAMLLLMVGSNDTANKEQQEQQINSKANSVYEIINVFKNNFIAKMDTVRKEM